MKKLFIFFISFLLFFSLMAIDSWAITYDLIAPSETLSRGQNVQFTINIDTEGTTITTAQVGMNYESGPLQYVGTTAGNSMTGVSVEQQATGKLLLTGTNQAGFSGKGTFAYVTFKIIADAPGSTTLCTLWAPTPTPTTPPATTNAPAPTTPPQLTTVPPKSGSASNTTAMILLGFVFLAGTLCLYLYKNTLTYDKKNVIKTAHKKTHKPHLEKS